VHGDAKLENFCFSDNTQAPNMTRVAAVDFQYTGGGCGVKDVAYFLSSCLSEARLQREAASLLDFYFARLCSALQNLKPHLDPSLVEAEWRKLFPLAWADFVRFMLGWAGEHYSLQGYSQQLTEQALDHIRDL